MGTKAIIFTVISIPVFALMYFITAVSVFTALLVAKLNLRQTLKLIIQFWANSIFMLTGKKLHVKGIDRITSGKKYILLTNHASLFDIPAIMSFYPGVSWFGREYLLKIPLHEQPPTLAVTHEFSTLIDLLLMTFTVTVSNVFVLIV